MSHQNTYAECLVFFLSVQTEIVNCCPPKLGLIYNGVYFNIKAKRESYSFKTLDGHENLSTEVLKHWNNGLGLSAHPAQAHYKCDRICTSYELRPWLHLFKKMTEGQAMKDISPAPRLVLFLSGNISRYPSPRPTFITINWNHMPVFQTTL